MNDAARQTLRKLTARHGMGLCSDARRCEALLRDHCGSYRREINILVGAIRERVPLDLLAARNSVPTGLLLMRLAKRLEDQLAVTQEASRWAVDSWALALGVVSDAELEALKSRRDEAAAPRIETVVKPSPTPARTTGKDGGQASKPVSPTQPKAMPPNTQQSSPLQPTQTSPATNRSAARPPHATPTRGSTARIGSKRSAPTQQQQVPSSANANAPARGTNAGSGQNSLTQSTAREGRGYWRGCMVGCFLIVLLSLLLAVGVPFVINILREEQQQRNLESVPGQTR